MSNEDQRLWTFHQTDNVENLLAGHPRHDMLFRKMTSFVGRGRILEIGFGDGYLLQKLSKRYECHGADISPENVVQMKEKIPGVSFGVIGVDGKLPYADDSFDAFVASEVLEHMSDAELSLCIAEMKRVLRKGGYAFITVPAKENLKDNECFCPNCGEKFHKWGHKQVWNDGVIRRRFSDFKITTVKEFFVRYQGRSPFEYLVGYGMFVMRNVMNKFIDIGNKSYLIILKNDK